MVLSISVNLGLFSNPQGNSSKSTSEGRICLTQPMQNILANFRLFVSQLDLWPTRIAKIIPGEPDYFGAENSVGLVWAVYSFPIQNNHLQFLTPHYHDVKNFRSTSGTTCDPSITPSDPLITPTSIWMTT